MLARGARFQRRPQSSSTEARTHNWTESCLQYKNPSKRLASYADHRLAVSKERASEAGLFHTGNEDILQCFSCGLKLKNWQPNDDPMKEHASHSKDCQYVIQKEGRDYINSASRQVEPISYHRLMEEYNWMKVERDRLLDENKKLCKRFEEDQHLLAAENDRLKEQLGQAKEHISGLEKEVMLRSVHVDLIQSQQQDDVREGVTDGVQNTQSTSRGLRILQERDTNGSLAEMVTSKAGASKPVASGLDHSSNEVVQTDQTLPKLLESNNQPGHQEDEAAVGGEGAEDNILSVAEESCIQNGYKKEDVGKAAKKLTEEGPGKRAQWPKHSINYAKSPSCYAVRSILLERFAA